MLQTIAQIAGTIHWKYGNIPAKIFPYYHCVSDSPCPHIEPLYPIKTVKEFREDLECLLKYFHPIDPRAKSKFSDESHGFLISFDDGLRQCYDTVVPILEEYNIKCVFFINSGFVDNQDLFFRFKYALLLGHLSTNPQLNPYPTLEAAQVQFAKISHQQMGQLDSFAEKTGFNFKEWLIQYKPYMSTAQILELHERGHKIGIHTHTHPLLASQSWTDRDKEIEQSILFLKKIIPNEPIWFSFPFTDHGISQHYLDHLYRTFDIEFTFGCAGWFDQHGRHIQRIGMETMKKNALTIWRYELGKRILRKWVGRSKMDRSRWT